MQRLRILGLSLLTVFALSVVASATASAEELPNLLPGVGTTFSAKSGKNAFRTVSGGLIECEKDNAVYEPTSAKLGKFDVLTRKCKSPATGATCWGLDDEKVLLSILILGTYHIRYISVPLRTVAIIYLMNHLHFLCEAFGLTELLLVLGCAAGKLTPTNTLTNKLSGVFNQEKGKDEITEVENEADTGTEKCTLTDQEGEKGKEEGGSVETTEEFETFEKEGKAVEALVMA